MLGHSIGAAASALALARGLRAERAVQIASPSAIDDVLTKFATFVGLDARATQAFFDHIEHSVGVPPDDLELASLALRHPTLLIHSHDDREVPHAESEAIARSWPRTQLLSVDGLGHRRILRDAAVIQAAVAMLTNAEPAPRVEPLSACG